MADIKDLIKGEVDKAKDDIGNIVGGLFSKKVKYTENEDGSISREIKVGKQKVNVTAVKGADGSYLVTDMPALDDKNMQKIVEKINEGKKLSKDEQLWVNVHDRTAAAFALKGMGYDDAAAMAHLPYTKDQLTGKQDIGTFFVNTQGFQGDKTAFLAGVKQQMIAVYGAEAGEKHFNDFVAMSGLNDELQKLADKEKTAAEAKKEEPAKVEQPQTESVKEQPAKVKEEPAAEPAKNEPAAEPQKPEPEKETPNAEPVRQEPAAEVSVDELDTVLANSERASVRETMKSDAAQEARPNTVSVQNREPAKVSVKDEMKNDGKIAATRDLLSRRGVKLADKEATLNKLVQNFGAEAAYEIALKCVVEPANTMSAMGEGFKRSGASLEYFASIDPNDKEKTAKVAALAGVPVKPMNNEPVRRMEPIVDTKGISPVSIVNAQLDVHIPEKLEPINYAAEQKYAEMCKKMNKETLIVEDLVKMGATRQDFDFVLNKMFGKEKGTSENIQSKVAQGFGLEGTSPVTKDFAVEVIGRVEDRKLLMSRSKGKSY